MSDLMEKLLEDEQNTDEKFVAAAAFFTGLKEPVQEKTKESSRRMAKPKNVKVKKIKAESARATKRIVSNSGASNIKMKAAPTNVRAPSNVRGQATLSGDPRRQNYRQIAPQRSLVKVDKPKQKARVVVKVSSVETELAKMMEKEAFIWPALRGAGEVAAKSIGRGGKAVADTTKAVAEGGRQFKAGYGANQQSVLGNFLSNTVGKLTPTAKAPGGFNSSWASNIPVLSSTGRGVRDLFRNADLVRKERAYRANQKAWLSKQREANTVIGPGGKRQVKPLTKEQTQNLANMRKTQQKNLDNFRAGMDARTVTGIPETAGNVMSRITGPDGKISIQSVMKGADDLGLFNPATLAAMGLSAKGSIDAARAAKAAAQKDKMLKWGIGGAAGLGALALLKNRNNPNA